jgi:hypothetical protein
MGFELLFAPVFRRAILLALGGQAPDEPSAVMILAAKLVCTMLSKPAASMISAAAPPTFNVDHSRIVGTVSNVNVPLPEAPTRMGGTVYQRMKATREDQRRTDLHGRYQTAPNATGALPRYTHSAAEQAQSGEDEEAAGMGKARPVRSRLTPPPVGTSGSTGLDSLRSRAPYQPYSRARASAAPGLGGEVLPYAAPGGTEYQVPPAVGLEGGSSNATGQEKAKEEK